uniref:Uncharacterized protein n=1 Tax=Anguilla anguilla TaxID=7936 RepID=A0A0E9VU36_ANGAN
MTWSSVPHTDYSLCRKKMILNVCAKFTFC